MKDKPMKGGGMPEFEMDHWEKKIDKTDVAGGRYCAQLAGAEEGKKSVDALANYVKKNRMQY